MAKNSKARQYTLPTIKKLYALSGNECAFPDCNVTFLDSETDINYSNICHIEDANPGGRYNSNMTDKQRASYKNLILLCPNHHIETNDTNKYPKETLLQMKREHEDSVRQKLSEKDILTRHSSVLSIVINHIGVSLFDEYSEDSIGAAPDPEIKIQHNKVIRYKSIIEEYKVYHGKLNKIYGEIEQDGSLKKKLLLENIKMLYLKKKSEYNSFDEITKNADNIIEAVEAELWQIIERDNTIFQTTPYEAIQLGILIILVDAFMRCKILEEPPKYDSK